MNKKSSLALALSIAMLLPVAAHAADKPKAPLSSASDFASLKAGPLIQKLEARIIVQEGLVMKGVQVYTLAQSILKDIATVAVDNTGAVKNQRMLDLLSDNGISISTKEGKALNQAKPQPTPEAAEPMPAIVVPADATADQKADIASLIKQSEAMIPQVAKSSQAQNALQKLAVGLIDLAKADPQAQELVKKYDIKQEKPQ